MIRIIDKNRCCGCTACVNVCVHGCISMNEDSEGFLYPKVDEDHCVDCHLCDRVCPYENIRIESLEIDPECISARLKMMKYDFKSSLRRVILFVGAGCYKSTGNCIWCSF